MSCGIDLVPIKIVKTRKRTTVIFRVLLNGEDRGEVQTSKAPYSVKDAASTIADLCDGAAEPKKIKSWMLQRRLRTDYLETWQRRLAEDNRLEPIAKALAESKAASPRAC
jgi:hypothetical protein